MDWVDEYLNVLQALRQLHECHKAEPTTRRWKTDMCEKLAQDEFFKAEVYSLREDLHVDPEFRRELERRHSEAADGFESPEAFQALVAGVVAIDLKLQHLPAIKSIENRLEAALGPLPVPVLVAALVDFDGDEFNLFSAFSHAPPLIYSSAGSSSDKSFRQWRSEKFKPNRVYLDVTLNSLDDVAWVWPWVENAQRALGIPPSRRGRLEGEPRQKAVLGTFTWSDLRKATRANRRLLSELENRYVEARRKTEEKRTGMKLTRDQYRGLRRRALKNFYKQVVYHPEMRDLKLASRRLGRPRSR
jgi:hypothetical protein